MVSVGAQLPVSVLAHRRGADGGHPSLAVWRAANHGHGQPQALLARRLIAKPSGQLQAFESLKCLRHELGEAPANMPTAAELLILRGRGVDEYERAHPILVAHSVGHPQVAAPGVP